MFFVGRFTDLYDDDFVHGFPHRQGTNKGQAHTHTLNTEIFHHQIPFTIVQTLPLPYKTPMITNLPEDSSHSLT